MPARFGWRPVSQAPIPQRQYGPTGRQMQAQGRSTIPDAGSCIPDARRPSGDRADNRAALPRRLWDFAASWPAVRPSAMVKTSTLHSYALALGSNRPLSGKRKPKAILREAVEHLRSIGRLLAIGPILTTAPIGPSLREYANSALLIESRLSPTDMLLALQAIEADLGRRRHRRWGARTLDIDIILWSGGRWSTRDLRIPHPAFRTRDFVLSPLSGVAPNWSDPLSGLSVRHLHARMRKAAPLRRPRG